MRGLGGIDCVDGEETALARSWQLALRFPRLRSVVFLCGVQVQKAGPCETNVQLAGGDMQAIVS